MGIKLSDLITDEMKSFYDIELIDERSFDLFSRMTTTVTGKKCVFLNSSKYIGGIDDTVGMIITVRDIYQQIIDMGEKDSMLDFGFCLSNNPRDTFFILLTTYESNLKKNFAKTIIGENCSISKNAYIAEEGVVIGKNVEIEDNVKIYPNVQIGNDVKIQAGSIIGAQLFNSYYKYGIHQQIPQNGKTVIKDNVLVGSNSVIAQAMYDYGETIIDEGVKIDALCSISHNDIVGKNCKICAGVILGGYVSIGDNSEIGLGATLKNAISIGSDAVVGMGSVVVFDVHDGETVFGNPARKTR